MSSIRILIKMKPRLKQMSLQDCLMMIIFQIMKLTRVELEHLSNLNSSLCRFSRSEGNNFTEFKSISAVSLLHGGG